MMRHSRLMLGVVASVVSLALAGCNKKPDTPVVVEPPAKTAPVQAKPAAPKDDATGAVKIEVNVEDPSARVLIDGNEFTAKELDQAVPLPAGEHTLVLKLGGKEVRTRRFTVATGKRQVVSLGEPNREAAEW